MGVFKHKTGDRVGPRDILVLNHTAYKDKNNKWIAEFECPDCGEPFFAQMGHIVDGGTTACRECTLDRMSQLQTIDLVGQTFGRLTVLRRDDSVPRGTKVYWICQCSCENKTIVSVPSYYLRNGSSRSCGCLRKEQAATLNFQDLIGRRFGKLVVVENLGKLYGGTSYYWKCQCDCGGTTVTFSDMLLEGYKKSCGCLKSYGEEFIGKWLRENNIPFEYQKKFDSCRNPSTGKLLPFDFFLPSFNLIIECDGEQHRGKTSENGIFTEEMVKGIQERDKIKDQWCLDNNIKILRIEYIDSSRIEQVREQLDAYFNSL